MDAAVGHGVTRPSILTSPKHHSPFTKGGLRGISPLLPRLSAVIPASFGQESRIRRVSRVILANLFFVILSEREGSLFVSSPIGRGLR